MIASVTVSRGGYTATVTGPGLNQSVTVNRPQALSAVYVGTQGPAGAASGGIEYPFLTPATQWTINHNLGYRPSVTLRGISQAQIGGDVDQPNVNQAIVTFASATAGYARVT